MPLPFASSSPVAARGFDPEGLARALLGPNASPDDIQRMLASIASAGPAGSAVAGHEEPDPEPDGDPDDAAYGYEHDWTKGVAKNTEPFQYGAPPSLVGGAALAGAALPLAPLLAPALGPMASGAITGAMGGAGGAMAFGDQDPASIGKKALGGAMLGGAASKVLPMLGSAINDKAPGLLRALSNTAKTDQAYAGLGGELSLPDASGALSLVPKWQQRAAAEESALLQNQPVVGAPTVSQSEPGLSQTFPSPSSPGLSLDPYKQPTPWGWRVDAGQVPKWQAPADPTPSLGSVGPIDPSREADLLRNMPVRLETTAAMRPPPQFPPPGQGTMPLPGAVTGPTEDVDIEALMRALGLSR